MKSALSLIENGKTLVDTTLKKLEPLSQAMCKTTLGGETIARNTKMKYDFSAKSAKVAFAVTAPYWNIKITTKSRLSKVLRKTSPKLRPKCATLRQTALV